MLKTQFDFTITCRIINLGPSKLSIGEKVLISNSSLIKKEQQKNNFQINNYNSNNYMESSYSRILDNIEENTGLSGLIQKYNPNYKLKLKMIDDALEKIESSRKKNSFNDTEISIIYAKNKDNNTSQINDIINNSNNFLNDSKFVNNNIPIPKNNKNRGKIITGKKIKIKKYNLIMFF